MNNKQFTKLIIATQHAEKRYNTNPTDINFLRWHNLENEYYRILRLRQDTQANNSRSCNQ